MAFRPSLRSIWTLVAMAAICYGLYIWAEYSRVVTNRDHYEEKLIAANRMNNALRALAQRDAGGGEVLESYGDPRIDAIVGQQFSTITTDIASFEEKLSSANPNLAAVAVEMLIEAKLKRGDRVAVAMTGSSPGKNLAVLCACDALGITPYTICALSSTWWGATDPRNTWLDMQKFLNDSGIVKSRIVASSRGGLDDNAKGLSATGRIELAAAAERAGVPLLESASGVMAGALWWKTFKAASPDQPFAAYVNVGEGVASLGHAENAQLLSSGTYRQLPVRNWPGRGALHAAAADGLPVVQISDASKLSRDYGLGAPKIPLSDPGRGDVFTSIKYDLRVTVTALIIAFGALFVLVRLDAKYFRLADAGVDPETLL
ncbi:MAG: poly-gamma-glutamate system protein [bacterium]|nr:poly-gamma-glutamate system protein [bacterium]